MKFSPAAGALAAACLALGATAEPLPTSPSAPGSRTDADAAPGSELVRTGDEIVIAGRFFHTGTPVTLWFDDGGYNAYRIDDLTADNPPFYDVRADRFGFRDDLNDAERAAIADGWSLEQLGTVVDQFVIHYDVCGTSAYCFDVLQHRRGLSVHFMLDADGRIYQTLDLAERAWHAAKANSRSIGIEIANIGAYRPDNLDILKQWYIRDAGGTRIVFPDDRPLGHLDPADIFRPARNRAVAGHIHGKQLLQFDLTDAQYDALIRLAATLVAVFPNLPNRVPLDDDGRLRRDLLSTRDWVDHAGLIGHYHLDENKIDPGPAFDWKRVTTGVDALLDK